MESVMNEVFKKDNRSDKNDYPAKRFGVVRGFSGEEGSSYSVERVEKRERGAAYPWVSTCGGDQRDGDKNTAVSRKDEWIEQDKGEE
jgi:hypothetical protein